MTGTWTSLALVVVAGMAGGGCRMCSDWSVSPGTTNLGADDAAALARIPDGACDTTIPPLMPLLVAHRMRLESAGEGGTARRTLHEERGLLFDLLSYSSSESEYAANGRLIEWRTYRSFLLGITQRSESGAAGTDTTSSWRVLGGLFGHLSREGHDTIQIFWISFGG